MKNDLIGINITDKELKNLTGVKNLRRLDEIFKIMSEAASEYEEYLTKPILIRPSVIKNTDWQKKESQRKYNQELSAKVHESSTWTNFGCLLPIGIVIIAFLLSFPIAHWMYRDYKYFQMDDEGMPVIITAIIVGSFIGGIYSARISSLVEKEIKPKWHETIFSSVNQYMKKFKTTPLGVLLDEVDNYNQAVQELVSYVHVIDQLAEAGNPIGIKDRDKTLGVYRTMRGDLIRALKTERIFRENPHIKPEEFSIDFMPFKTIEFDQQAKDCERLVNKAMEIGVRVQDEMRNLTATPDIFVLTPQAFKQLKDFGVPQDILERLKRIIDEQFLQRDNFLRSLEKQIGEENTNQYKEIILKYARTLPK